MYRWMRDPFVRSNVGLHRTATLAKTRAWLRRAVRDRSIHAYAVVYDEVHVGNIVLDHIDGTVGTARLSIYVGLGRGALRAALKKAFTELQLNKVWLVVQVDNRAAIRAYRSAGFVREGRLRQEFLIDGRRTDVLYMGLLRSEFRRLR